MKNENKILDLALKLKALADQGEGGEKRNATELLDAYMIKHNITWEMLQDDVRTKREFIIRIEQDKFFNQIVYSVVGTKGVRISYYKKQKANHKKQSRFVELTELEYIEIKSRLDFYWPRYQAYLIIFYKAFIQKNKLYTKPSNEEREYVEPTPEEKAELYRLMQMMEGLERHQFHKQLENH